MALNDEEQRALEYNERLKRRPINTQARKLLLKGDQGKAADLLADTEPLAPEGKIKTGRQKDLIRYDPRFDFTKHEDDC